MDRLDPLAPADLPAPSRCESTDDLPDLFGSVEGEPVETADAWRDRRAKLEQLLRHYVYGYAPDSPAFDTTVERTPGILDGVATLVETDIEFTDLPSEAPSIRLALCLPADAVAGDRAVPVLFGLNWGGNHAVIDDTAVTKTNAAAEHGADERGAGSEFWCVERVLSRGYGFVTYHIADVDPDTPAVEDGVRPYFDDELPGPPGTEWGTIAAWAWGIQRCVDALRSMDGVRGDEIAVTGHSRCGKAALLAGATDERIGLVAPHQSGTGGMALSRDNGQESVGDITEAFPPWFADTFSAFANQEARLPVDQHALVALVAPRPLIDTEGARDYWANPGRAFDALQAAAPVWDLLGEAGLVSDRPIYEPEAITDETVGTICQYRRGTAHALDQGYVDAILDFADLHFDGAE